MTRYSPIALGVLLIVGLTIIQFRMTDRSLLSPLGSGTNVTADQQAELLKRVPKDFGNWRGEDRPIEEQVRETAGAVGAVSRVYRNVRTNEVVDLWLIVGHGRAISRHTPDVCYRNSGFGARAPENSLYPMEIDDETQVPFLTNTFYREDVTGRRLIRVFWTWYNTADKKNEGKVVWEAPSNARWYFGNTRALYKMYFTSEMRDPMETAEQSPCLQFAKEFLPEVEKALSAVHSGSKPADGEEKKGDASTQPESAADTQDSATDEVDEPAVEAQDATGSSVTDLEISDESLGIELTDEPAPASELESTDANPIP